MSTIHDTKARELLYELWIQYAEKLLEKVIKITELSEEQADALRRVYLRPNDFAVIVEGDVIQEIALSDHE
jgi:sulfur carrier protein ThiS